MEKSKTFRPVVLDGRAIASILSELNLGLDGEKYPRLSVSQGPESWTFDSIAQFLAEARRGFSYLGFTLNNESLSVECRVTNNRLTKEAHFSISASDRETIEAAFQRIESIVEHFGIIPETPLPAIETPQKPVIFIGHGRSQTWRDLKDHLTEKHGMTVEAFEVGSRAGHTIRDILEEMLSKSSIAFLVLTGEDEGKDGIVRARENVIHELGLFQGKLGFPRAIALLEDSANEFSNLHGVQQIRFGNGNIREVFGEVVAVIKREFPE